MYHLEIRQFPHNVCRFNLTDAEIRAVLEPWTREQAVEFGERKWSPHTARLTILEGPPVAMDQLTMGRGWRAAQRQGEDVTERLLAAAKQVADAASGASAQAPPDPSLGADPPALGVESELRSVASLLGPSPTRLLQAWRVAAARAPGLTPSESLALAEHAVKAPDANPS